MRGVEMEKYELEWHELKTEKPRIWGHYLVYFPANNKTNNGDYIDLCFWNEEKFLGGITRGAYDGLKITHWMELPPMPIPMDRLEKWGIKEPEIALSIKDAIVALDKSSKLFIEVFTPIFNQLAELINKTDEVNSKE
jgi:hypothetical protein